jgi:hypothetical protein
VTPIAKWVVISSLILNSQSAIFSYLLYSEDLGNNCNFPNLYLESSLSLSRPIYGLFNCCCRLFLKSLISLRLIIAWSEWWFEFVDKISSLIIIFLSLFLSLSLELELRIISLWFKLILDVEKSLPPRKFHNR